MKNKGRYYFEKKIVLLIGICIIIMILQGFLVEYSIKYKDPINYNKYGTGIARSYMRMDFGGNWRDEYETSIQFTSPFIEDNHRLVRVEYCPEPREMFRPAFALLLIDNEVQRIYPLQYNKKIKRYNQKKIASNDDALTAFKIYLQLYGMESEKIFENDIHTYVNNLYEEQEELIDLNLTEASKITVNKTNYFWTVSLYTISEIPTDHWVPTPFDVIFTHYIAEVSESGEIYIKEKQQYIYPDLVWGPK